MDKRTPRTNETREAESRPVTWTPPSLLPDPAPQDGYKFRWVRTTLNGQPDPSNVSYRMREGWVACKRSDHPELAHLTDPNSKNPENIESGGLLLCKMPVEMIEARDRHFRDRKSTRLNSSHSQQSRMPSSA